MNLELKRLRDSIRHLPAIDRLAATGASTRSSAFYRDPQAAFDALIRICRQTNENGNSIV